MNQTEINKKPELTLIAAGPGWMAVDKPAGLSVHNDPDTEDVITLALAVLRGQQKLRLATAWNENFHPAPVHRLDRETSGVLLLATDKIHATALQQTFEARETKKVYRAIVRKPISASTEWKFPLTDKAEGRKSPAGPAGLRKPCETKVTVIRSTKHISEIEIALLTGRQHQIRRHAVLAGHEVVGDNRYGDPKYIKNLSRLLGVEPRMMLHASRLELEIDGKNMEFHSPLPSDFELFFEETRI